MTGITKTKKKSNKILNIIFWVVLGVIALYAVVALFSSDDGATTLFGKDAFTVKTNSMAPTFEKGDLIYVDTNFEVEDISIGDVITYQTYIDVTGDGVEEWVYNSHRVVGINDSDGGGVRFVTKGDNNDDNDSESVPESYVVGVWIEDGVVKNIGGIIDGIVGFLKSGTGFFIFIVIPCFAFLVYEIYKFINVVTEYKTQQALGDRVKLQEEALALARAQLEEEARLQALKKEEEEKE